MSCRAVEVVDAGQAYRASGDLLPVTGDAACDENSAKAGEGTLVCGRGVTLLCVVLQSTITGFVASKPQLCLF